ncbi:DUF1501 domain-containing protein [Granulosicoccus sp.]|nr:DUF1501 domain-containing protein [Granulosicoccus sp.]
MDRRKFLQTSGAGLGVAAGFASNLASLNAFAAETSGYKALVCVFLRGGMDTHDMIIPFDLESSRAYEDIRAAFIDSYPGSGFASRRNAGLLDLSSSGSNGSTADGRDFAMPQEMVELRDLYQQNKVAVVGNVGPLIEPLNITNYTNNTARVPKRLFSHSSQQTTWMASPGDTAREGWGGRYGDFMLAANANRRSAFTSVTTFGNNVFVNGFNVAGFNLSARGGQEVEYLRRSFGNSSQFIESFRRNLFGLNYEDSNLFHKDIGTITSSALDDNMLVSQIFAESPDPTTPFPGTNLAGQLRIVAKMIAAREALGLSRQIFFVADNGYDTHSNQARALPESQRGISQAMAAFYEETVALGVSESVTTFTASDFGRTLVPNNSGTDHGWGSHHMVMGGAVNGGQIYGDIPPAVEGHSQDSGRGRLIPEVSIDQYASIMGRWFGLSASEVLQVFPNLNLQNPEALSGMLPNDGEEIRVQPPEEEPVEEEPVEEEEPEEEPPEEIVTGVLDRSSWSVAANRNNGDTPNAVDGNASTRWTTNTDMAPGQSFMIDMGTSQTFNRVVLDTTGSVNDYPRGYDLLVSNDGSNWTTVASGNGDSVTTSIAFGSQQARFIRIDQTGSHDRWWWSIHDLNVYNG